MKADSVVRVARIIAAIGCAVTGVFIGWIGFTLILAPVGEVPLPFVLLLATAAMVEACALLGIAFVIVDGVLRK